MKSNVLFVPFLFSTIFDSVKASNIPSIFSKFPKISRDLKAKALRNEDLQRDDSNTALIDFNVFVTENPIESTDATDFAENFFELARNDKIVLEGAAEALKRGYETTASAILSRVFVQDDENYNLQLLQEILESGHFQLFKLAVTEAKINKEKELQIIENARECLLDAVKHRRYQNFKDIIKGLNAAFGKQVYGRFTDNFFKSVVEEIFDCEKNFEMASCMLSNFNVPLEHLEDARKYTAKFTGLNKTTGLINSTIASRNTLNSTADGQTP